MLCIRRLYSTFFTRKPLNYEALSLRVAELRSFERISRDLILDYTKANRILQRINKEPRGQIKVNSTGRANFLALKVNIPNAKLEDELWDFFKEHWEVCVSDEEIVAAFILNPNADIARSFQIVKANFSMSQSGLKQLDTASLLLRKLLKKTIITTALASLTLHMAQPAIKTHRRHC